MEHRTRVLLLISAGSFMAFVDAPIVSVAFPAIQESFPDASATTLAWVLDGYFVAFAALLVGAGKFADRFGRRRLFVGGMWLFALTSLACAVAPSAETLIAARLLQGLAAALVVPAGQGLMLAIFPAEERKTAIGVLAAIVGLGTALSPAIGGVVVEWTHWRWIFCGSVVAAAAVALRGMALLERDQPQRTAPIPDLIGAAFQAGGLALLVLAILKRDEWGTGDERTLVTVLLAVAAIVFSLWRSGRHRAPVVDLEMFRVRTFAVANASALVFSIGFFGMLIAAVLFLSNVWGFSVLETGLQFIPGALFGAVWGRPAGTLAERHGPRLVTIAGAAIAGAGVLLILVSTSAEPNYWRDWLPGQLLYSAGAVIALTGVVGGALTAVPPAQFALASGLNSAIRQVGGAIGVALVVAITAAATPATLLSQAHDAFVVCMVAMFLGAVIALPMGSPAGAEVGAGETPEIAAGAG